MYANTYSQGRGGGGSDHHPVATKSNSFPYISAAQSSDQHEYRSKQSSPVSDIRRMTILQPQIFPPPISPPLSEAPSWDPTMQSHPLQVSQQTIVFPTYGDGHGDSQGSIHSPGNVVSGSLSEESRDGFIYIIFCGGETTDLATKIKQHLQMNFQGLRVVEFDLHTELHQEPKDPYRDEAFIEAKVQIILLSPRFIELVRKNHWRNFCSYLRTDAAMAVLQYLTYETVSSEANIASWFPFYNEWPKVLVNDETTAMEEIFNKVSYKIHWNSQIRGYTVETPAFSVSSEIITKDNPDVYIHLESPMPAGARCEVMEMILMYRPYVKVHNPYTLSFTIPEQLIETSSVLDMSVIINGTTIGKHNIRCRGTLEILRAILYSKQFPVEFMEQALTLSGKNELDEFLSSQVRNNSPFPKTFTETGKAVTISRCVLPTWLHFSAYYGLGKFVLSLLEVPYCENSLTMRNVFSKTPSEIALDNNHIEVAQDLDDICFVINLVKQRENQLQGDSKTSHGSLCGVIPSSVDQYDEGIYFEVNEGGREIIHDSEKEAMSVVTAWMNKKSVESFLLELKPTIANLRFSYSKLNQLDSGPPPELSPLPKIPSLPLLTMPRNLGQKQRDPTPIGHPNREMMPLPFHISPSGAIPHSHEENPYYDMDPLSPKHLDEPQEDYVQLEAVNKIKIEEKRQSSLEKAERKHHTKNK